ncbi:short-chain dehydrogenase/reductase family 16C member 6-like isoform X1 [Cebus imitator]|uniref:short-chain dehydrogenase/reductase family 16C member 6-like isoform X1 n=1 Tax=Cebus imitator TaxID=2715852 RepID=UPI001899F577|nr:short-chain dehydrogenase/reductase family 16C member 6-like isoform X1 [Cebus imitator]
MDAIAGTSIFLGKFLYDFLESLVYKIIPKTKKNVAGEIVLIAGAGSGLGRQLATHFAGLGAILVLWDINQEDNVETCRLAKEKGGEEVFPCKCDCRNRQEVCRVADQVRKEVGDVTILINNASIVTGKLFFNIPDHMVEKSFLVNAIFHFWVNLFLYHFLLLTYKAFLPAMIRINHVHLVCISSVAGVAGINGLSDYSASKFAAFGFAESLFFELAILKKTGITTTIVCPCFINTGMFQGCTTKYPFLLPILEQEYVAKEILNAILEEQVFLMIHKFLYIALILKQIMSRKMLIAFGDYLGVDTCTASFKRRKKTNEL